MKKKGFTLIELLAVIVILAIIMVLAIPKILDVIEKSRMESFKSSVGLMVDSARIMHASNKITNAEEQTAEYTFEGGDYSPDSPKLNFKGDKPYSGIIRVNKNGRVSLALISKNKKYCATKEYTGSVKVKLEDGVCETNEGLEASTEKDVIPDLSYISKDFLKSGSYPSIKSISFKKSSDAPTTHNGKSDISVAKDGSVYLYGIIDSTNPSNISMDMIITSDTKISVSEATMEGMFKDMTTLQSISFENFDTSTVINMKDLFLNCTNLKSIEYLGNFKTSKVTDFSHMFSGCESITSLDVSNFKTSRVTDFSGMFASCKLLKTLNVSNFNTSNATAMGGMFSNCTSLTKLDLSNFDTSKVTEFSWMFSNCTSLTSLNVSSFDTSNAYGFQGMFEYCTSLSKLNLSSFKTPNLVYIDHMFTGCINLTELDLSNITSENITYIGNMFKDCTNLKKVDLSSFDVPKKIDYGNTLNHNSPLFYNTSNEMTIYVKNAAAQEYFNSDRTSVNSSYNTTFIIK